MEKYEGITDFDEIIGGGKYVRTHKEGGEIYNFLNRKGYCYGYVQPVNKTENVSGGTINLKRLGASIDASSIVGVDVVLTATRPKEGGTYIIGWYKNATVFREKQDFDISEKENHFDTQGNQFGFRFLADYRDVTLLPSDRRVFKIPRATGKFPVKGGMGQSNVWYAQDLNNEGFFMSVRKLVDTGHFRLPTKHSPSKPNIEKNKLVESIAVNLTTEHFESYGYVVNSVEKDNYGWDIEASVENLTLKIEVKGLSGKVVNVELTPNEYKAFKAVENQFVYRLCIVTECLAESPKLHIFSFNIPSGEWVDESGKCLNIQLKTAASITLI